ncbi:hypothetical protein D9M68_905270 [compost metagenome]
MLAAQSLQLRFEVGPANGAVAGDEGAGVVRHRADELMVAATGEVGGGAGGTGGEETAQQVTVVVVVVLGHGGGEGDSDEREGCSGIAETHGDSLGFAFPSDCRR